MQENGVNFRMLDEDFVLMDEPRTSSIQWRRRYYEYGNWTMLLTVENYNPKWTYIFHIKTGEVGIINKDDLEVDETGNMLTISGIFFEHKLSNGVVLDKITSAVNIGTYCQNIVRNRLINDSDIQFSNIHIGTITPAITATTDAYEESLSEVGAIAQSLLKSIDFSQRLRFDYDTKQFYYDIWQGIDRTVEGPNHCTFSDGIGNMSKLSYSSDDTNYKNYAEILLEWNDTVIHDHFSWDKEGEEVNKMLYSTSITTEDAPTRAQAIAMAKQEAKLELLNHYTETAISFEPYSTLDDASFKVGQIYEYGKHYDLGDKVNVIMVALELQVAFRIIGVDEIYEDGKRDIKLQFGDFKKLNYMRGRF